jgi:hypothetical protein
MKIQYDTPIEVNQKQYGICMTKYHGICAGRKDGDKYYIKVLLMKYAKEVERDLINNQ